MRIGLDVMGGDYAPKATIGGAILAQRELSAKDRIVLFGDENLIKKQISELGGSTEDFDIMHSSEVIEMGDSPIKAFTNKPDSSISKGFRKLKNGDIDSFASSGNTGAMLVGSIYSINPIPGIIRPATTSVIPKEDGSYGVLIDVGTNPDSKPDVLYQFGILGSIYAEHVYNIKNPRVGLLNIGSEEEKGSLLCQSAYRLMKDTTDFNFIGNVEGRDLFKSEKVDVIVCDGFTGNVVLKQIEAMYRIMLKRGLTDDYFDRFNYENYGGTPILGVNSTVLIGHGISNDIAIKNMIMLSKEVHSAGIAKKIAVALESFSATGNNNGAK